MAARWRLVVDKEHSLESLCPRCGAILGEHFVPSADQEFEPRSFLPVGVLRLEGADPETGLARFGTSLRRRSSCHSQLAHARTSRGVARTTTRGGWKSRSVIDVPNPQEHTTAPFVVYCPGCNGKTLVEIPAI